MGNSFRTGFFLLTLSLSIICSCSDPISFEEIDQRLIGEWYLIDTVYNYYPSPDLSFYGIQINNDKNVKLLGIETSSGYVSIWKEDYKTILSANQGIFVLKYFAPPGIRIDTCTYYLENGKLIVSDEFDTFLFTKTRLGEQIFEPVNSNLSFNVDSVIYENDNISDSPSAFTSRKSASELFLRSSMNHTYLCIDINEFTGTGSYEISFEEGRFTIWYGDAGAIYFSDSISTGNITITEYDEINNICSGSFYFTSIGPGAADTDTVEISEGFFDVPLYK